MTGACTVDVELVEETPERWRIDRRGQMRVAGIVFASRALLPDIEGDQSLHHVVKVAGLPGSSRRRTHCACIAKARALPPQRRGTT
jgi:tRNA-splicing ligase RtcB